MPALGSSAPAVVLALLGISVGSAVTVTAAKIAKNTTCPENVAAAGLGPWRPRLIQIFLREEGTYADQVVDITKLQFRDHRGGCARLHRLGSARYNQRWRGFQGDYTTGHQWSFRGVARN